LKKRGAFQVFFTIFATVIKNVKNMATITLEYNPQTKGTLEFVNRIRESGFFTIKIPSKRKSGIEEAMEDIKIGKVYKAKNAKDLINQCLQ